MSLIKKAKAFLEAGGAQVEERDRAMLLAREHGLGGRQTTMCLWIAEPEGQQQIRSLESSLLTRFEGAVRRYRGASLHLLVPALEGFSTDFRQRARILGVRVVPPPLFFDTQFRYESAPSTASIIASLAKDAESLGRTRVSQPYSVESFEGDATAQAQGDIVDDLLRETIACSRSRDPRIWVIAAPAGYGKSIMFASLFGRLYREFQERKRRQEYFPRPLPMLAEHLREAAGPNLARIDRCLPED